MTRLGTRCGRKWVPGGVRGSVCRADRGVVGWCAGGGGVGRLALGLAVGGWEAVGGYWCIRGAGSKSRVVSVHNSTWIPARRNVNNALLSARDCLAVAGVHP